MADDVVIASELDLEAILAPLARAKRMVFFADCPGVGKSLFIRELARELGAIQSICVGAEFVFGHKRRGNVALLKQLGAFGVACLVLPLLAVISLLFNVGVVILDEQPQMLQRPLGVSHPLLSVSDPR